MGGYSKAMFELTQSMEWTRLEKTLQIEHYGGQLAIPIPDELVCEKNESKNKRRKLKRVRDELVCEKNESKHKRRKLQ